VKIEEREERYTLALETNRYNNRYNLEGEFSPSEAELQECCSYQTVESNKTLYKRQTKV
jgi:hypothetical protein